MEPDTRPRKVGFVAGLRGCLDAKKSLEIRAICATTREDMSTQPTPKLTVGLRTENKQSVSKT